MDAGPSAEPIAEAPQRTQWTRALTSAASENWSALLIRAGASGSEAAAASAGLDPLKAGSTVQVTLSSGGAIRRIEAATGLGRTYVVTRAESGFTHSSFQQAIDIKPLRITGLAGDGLYWSLRGAGASPEVAAQYLKALATEIDVGAIGPGERFDLILASQRVAGGERQVGDLLYAGLARGSDSRPVRMVRFGGKWVDAVSVDRPQPRAEGLGWPVSGHVTSWFGYRIHPILRFKRFHSGLDFGASFGSPIVATADGEVVRAGWAGGYGRQVRIVHSGGVQTSYSHMSGFTVAPGSYVRRGEVIGYVGSSGLSTGPHLHYEVIAGGHAVNPMGVRLTTAPVVDHARANAVKARLAALMKAASGA